VQQRGDAVGRAWRQPFAAAPALWPAEHGSAQEGSFRPELQAQTKVQEPKTQVREPTSQEILVGAGAKALVGNSSSLAVAASPVALQFFGVYCDLSAGALAPASLYGIKPSIQEKSCVVELGTSGMQFPFWF
jgi:hypothetical protein